MIWFHFSLESFVIIIYNNWNVDLLVQVKLLYWVFWKCHYQAKYAVLGYSCFCIKIVFSNLVILFSLNRLTLTLKMIQWFQHEMLLIVMTSAIMTVQLIRNHCYQLMSAFYTLWFVMWVYVFDVALIIFKYGYVGKSW